MPPARSKGSLWEVTARGKQKCSGYQKVCTDCVMKEARLRERRAERERKT